MAGIIYSSVKPPVKMLWCAAEFVLAERERKASVVALRLEKASKSLHVL